MRGTPRERARRRWRLSLAALALGVVAAIVGGVLGLDLVREVVAPLLVIGAVILGGLAATITTRRHELTWIVAGILIFWVANTALYLHLSVEANTTLDTVPSQQVIDLLSTLFDAGVAALIAAALITVVAWAARPGRWNALNGPGGQS